MELGSGPRIFGFHEKLKFQSNTHENKAGRHQENQKWFEIDFKTISNQLEILIFKIFENRKNHEKHPFKGIHDAENAGGVSRTII